MLHAMLRFLVERGHSCHVLTRDGKPQDWEGVTVQRATARNVRERYPEYDVVLTHLDLTHHAVLASRKHGKPLVHVVHNDRQLEHWALTPADAALVVFNSRWIAQAHGWWKGDYMVLPPPVFADDYRVRNEGDAITLINLSEQKGAEVFWQLAKDEPSRRFLGVIGGYGSQMIPREIPRNVTLMENSPDVRRVYEQTRILLMPSKYESWGRVAVEAACSGIPTIAAPTPGLRECLGASGLFVNKPSDWRKWIRKLDDPKLYARVSNRVRARADELDPVPSLRSFEVRLKGVVAAWEDKRRAHV